MYKKTQIRHKQTNSLFENNQLPLRLLRALSHPPILILKALNLISTVLNFLSQSNYLSIKVLGTLLRSPLSLLGVPLSACMCVLEPVVFLT